MFDVLACSVEQRSFFRDFQCALYEKLGFKKVHQINIGKNFSYLIVQKDGNNFIVLFDVDDGSGITACRPGHLDGDCKLIVERFNQLKEQFNAKKTIVFKLQFNPDDCEYYPFKENVYPAGYFCDNQNKIRPIDQSIEKNIDVFWMGTVNKDGEPWNWPKEKDMKLWPSGRRRAGYYKLKEIEERRKDLKIICSSDKIPQAQYDELINRAKICVELPGCGWFTKRLVENIRKGKCILSLEQKQKLHVEYLPNQHYELIESDEFLDLEEKIDKLLSDPALISNYENQSKNISNFFDYQYMIEYIVSTINKAI